MPGKNRAGPQASFPFLGEYDRYDFPVPEKTSPSIIAAGGNLSPGMLLSAYEQGIFPWYNPGDPILWQSPDPRFVIFPGRLHISASMKKLLKKEEFEVSFDRDFRAVITACANIPREDQAGTWITDDMIEAYTALHRLGWAHSAESRLGGKLAGGCYGIRLGRVFFGESMFAEFPNASKAAFLTLAALLFADGVAFIDCQIPTDHLASLGGTEISREDFLALLRRNVSERNGLDRRGNWRDLYPGTLIKSVLQSKIGS